MAIGTVKITGTKEVIANLNKLARRSPFGAAVALFKEAESIMTASKESFVPVAPDGGILKASGQVEIPDITLVGASVTMGYGGDASAYALAVHEHPSKHSPPTWKGKQINWNVGGPKYLEKPLRNAMPGMAVRLAASIRAFIRKTV